MNAYPNLNGNRVFVQNYQEVEKLECELQRCINDYNAIVKEFNDGTNTFPSFILAGIFRFKKRNFAKRT